MINFCLDVDDRNVVMIDAIRAHHLRLFCVWFYVAQWYVDEPGWNKLTKNSLIFAYFGRWQNNDGQTSKRMKLP